MTGKIEVGDELKLVSDNKENKEFILDATPYHNRYKRRYTKITEIISPTEFKIDCGVGLILITARTTNLGGCKCDLICSVLSSILKCSVKI